MSPEKVAGETLHVQMRFNFLIRLRFVAKVVLSAGYYIFGDYFKNYVSHADTRRMMYASNVEEFKAIKSDNPTLYYDTFTPVKDEDRVLICHYLHCVTVLEAHW